MTLGYQQFVVELHASLASSGFDDLGRSDGVVFRALADRRMSVSRLAELLDISKQGAAQIATDMERRGYLARRPDPDDRRAWLLELSERGTAALAAARAFHHRYERGLAKRCGTETVGVLRSVLTEMAGPAAARPDPRLKALFL
jgi:DNA-binding MarR family transcriptional regulator